MERLSIKNVEFSERLSEETNAYACDVYLDNKKFGYARNDGRGGMTDIRHYEGKIDILKEAEAYADNLPPMKGQYGELKMSLDFAVDILLDEWLQTRVVKKLQTKAIVFEPKEGGVAYKQLKSSIKKYLSQPHMIPHFQKMVDDIKADGGKILNTNLKGLKV